jgi:hypothetical protein
MQLISFCTMVILVILGTWIVYGERHLIRKGLASYSWKAAEGVIVDSFDETFVTAGVDRNNAGIVPVSYKQTGHAYEYEVDGRSYQSNTYCFGAYAEQAGAAFAIGAKVKLYYDPRNPQSAVLNRGLQPSMFVGFLLIGGAILMAWQTFF